MNAALPPSPEGIALRRWSRDDAAALIEHANDREVSRYTSHRFPYPFTQADAERFLTTRISQDDDTHYAIVIDAQPCGGLGVTLGEGDEQHTGELGYWLSRRHWGGGRMSALIAHFVPWAMRRHRLYRVEARVHQDNAASLKVLQRNGFELEARMRHAVFKHDQLGDCYLLACTRDRLDD